MQARVKADHRWKSLSAFSGHEYIKSEWRPVPAGYEAEAMTHPDLELDGELDGIVEVKPPVETAFVNVKPTAEAKLEEMVASQPIVIETEPLMETEPETEPETVPEKKPRTFKKKE